ncbi:PREDICTED: LOW QUALITY PROTEIN: histone H1oo [Pseudopodoces humilis]|uniref:LOW QUALITY PROTEIN: histone H1oo n=1 Tax=Pseudopodoces humilis TaxID=181119 RepID=UPI0006B6A753|nr:PREDICTED: LOW QUALITY PROTEIN: histone H1oo [Pseudopodoces humilis]
MVPLPAAKAAGIAQRCQAQHPPTLQMIKEALRAHDEKKGASVVAIKRFILAKYPTVDPIRLKYMLKQALSKGLSCGDLVRPHNSSAVGATGTFKVSGAAGATGLGLRCCLALLTALSHLQLALKKSRYKQQPGQADPDRGQTPKPGQEGTTKAPQAPVAGARQRGATKQQPTATKQQPKAKPVKAQPRAAEKPRSDRAKHPQTAGRSQAHGPGPSGPPRAASHRQGPQKGHSGPSTARAAENAGGTDSDSSASAGAKGPQKAPKGKSKGKVPKGAQQDAPKAQGGQGQAKKPRATPGAGQGKARLKKAVPMAADRKAP